MINLILLFPLLACLLIFLLKNERVNTWAVNIYAILHLVISIAYCCNVDFLPFWKAPALFTVNSRNILFLLVMSIVFLAVAIYNNSYIKNSLILPAKSRHFAYMILFFVFSMTGAVLSANLGLNWVFIEATTLASAYLIYFHKTKHSIEAAWKYVFICSIGIALAFVGIILLSISTGSMNSLNYSDLYNNAEHFNEFWLKLAFVFIMFGIGTKMGLAPVHFWLPDAHAESPSPISALLSATLLNSAFLMILNVYGLMILTHCDTYARIMMLVMGFLSIFVTAVFVYHINNYKRMLAYSSVENMGILIIGVALGGSAAFAATLHLIAHSLIKASLFLTSGNILSIYSTKKIKSVTGLLKVEPITAWLWVLSFIGIVAFPPSLLFVSEFMIVKVMLEAKHYILCAVFLLLLTIILYGLGKSVIGMVFSQINSTKFDEQKDLAKKINWTMYFPQIVLLLIAFALGLYIPTGFLNIINNTMLGF